MNSKATDTRDMLEPRESLDPDPAKPFKAKLPVEQDVDSVPPISDDPYASHFDPLSGVDPLDPLGLLEFFNKLDERDGEMDEIPFYEPDNVDNLCKQPEYYVPQKCCEIVGENVSSGDEQERGPRSLEVDYEESSSSGSSTVMSESNPHWAAFTEREPWGAEETPPFKLSDFELFDLTDEELAGILTDRFIAAGLSFLSPSPFTCKYSLNKLKLSGKNIYDISRLEKFCYIQYVDVSRNYLTDVTALGNLPFLMYLDASSNRLTTLLSFKAPLNLTYVNYSNNEVQFIDDLSDFWTITNLNISHNAITKIEGLNNLRFLRILDLSFNLIFCIENISRLRLSQLYLNNNEITEFEIGENLGLKTLQYLQFINLDYNKLSNLMLFKDTFSLEKISMIENEIAEVFELDNLKTLVNLKEFNLMYNPVTECYQYRQIVLSTVPTIAVLDTRVVSVEEKIEAKINLDPDERIIASRYHTLLLVMEQINEPVVQPYIIPIDETQLPIVILVGPEASMKGHLTRFAGETLPNKVSIAVSHTSRNRKENEIEGVHYYYMSRDKINDMGRTGCFVSYTEIFGDCYALDRRELNKAHEKRSLCITHMDLNGATVMVNRGLRPHLVLTIAENEEVHLRRLRRKYKLPKADAPCGSTECNKDMCETLCSACADSTLYYKKKGATEDEALFSDSFVDNIVDVIADDAIRASKKREDQKQKEIASREVEANIKQVLHSRKNYFLLRDKGFFSSIVYTDDINLAYVNLINILKRVFHIVISSPPNFTIYNDEVFKKGITRRLQKYMSLLNRHHPSYSADGNNG